MQVLSKTILDGGLRLPCRLAIFSRICDAVRLHHYFSYGMLVRQNPLFRINRLTHAVRYRPYKSYSAQVLSSFSACALVAISGLLLRSQSLLSAARSPNFEPIDPSIESSSVSTELIPIIVLLIMLLAAPAILAIVLALMKWFRSRKNDSQLCSSTKVSAHQVPAALVDQNSDLFAKEAAILADNIPVLVIPEICASIISNESDSVPHANLNDPFRSLNQRCSPSAAETNTDGCYITQIMTHSSESVSTFIESSGTLLLPDPDGALSNTRAAGGNAVFSSMFVPHRIAIAEESQHSSNTAAAGLGNSRTNFASTPVSAFLPDPDNCP
jgi:hypothetical protein